MRFTSDPTFLTLPAYAKINLFLDITGKLPNGYHSLNNIMQQIGLCDEVTITLGNGSGINITCDEPKIPVDKRNIAYKAAELFIQRSGLEAKIGIDIKKRIPIMAGLGGSSTDGAAVLVGLNRLCGNFFSQSELEQAGALLGADVPFCIRGKAAFCKGIGEKMEDIISLERCSIIVVKPDFSCNTSEAYALYDKTPIKSVGEPDRLLSALKEKNIRQAGKSLYNVFEELYSNERLNSIKKELLELKAVGALLSGSGSAVYGLFEDEETAHRAFAKLKYENKFISFPLNL